MIALTLEVGADQGILDERRPWQHAWGSGSWAPLGVLRAAKLSGRIPEVKGPLAALVGSRFWIEPTLVKALLQELGEAD